MVNGLKQVLHILDHGRQRDYHQMARLQEELHGKRVRGEIPDTLLLLEHRAVYTLGRSAAPENLLWQAQRLEELGVQVVATNRGGDVTWHGPGQLVGYAIVHLGCAKLTVLEYIEALEEALIRTVASFGVQAGRDKRNRGIWVGNAKLAAIGIRVSRQVTMHGCALNVAPELEAYQGIVPCGLRDATVTSLQQLLGTAPNMDAVKRVVVREFCRVMGYAVATHD